MSVHDLSMEIDDFFLMNQWKFVVALLNQQNSDQADFANLNGKSAADRLRSPYATAATNIGAARSSASSANVDSRLSFSKHHPRPARDCSLSPREARFAGRAAVARERPQRRHRALGRHRAPERDARQRPGPGRRRDS